MSAELQRIARIVTLALCRLGGMPVYGKGLMTVDVTYVGAFIAELAFN